MIFVIFCIILYILWLKSTQKVVLASKNWSARRSLVELHNTQQPKTIEKSSRDIVTAARASVKTCLDVCHPELQQYKLLLTNGQFLGSDTKMLIALY